MNFRGISGTPIIDHPGTSDSEERNCNSGAFDIQKRRGHQTRVLRAFIWFSTIPVMYPFVIPTMD